MLEKIAILLRGHVRNAFNKDNLYIFLKKLSMIYDIDIYIYTFKNQNCENIYSNININQNNNIITDENILKYFKDLDVNIKKIIIDNSSAETLNDKIVNNVSKNKYLHMWQSIYRVTSMVENNNNNYKYVINIRIDYFELINRFPKTKLMEKGLRKLFCIDLLLDFIPKINPENYINLLNIAIKKETSYFYNKRNENVIKLMNLNFDADDILYGIDNVIAGKLHNILNLSSIFVNNIDDIFNFYEEILPNLEKVINSLGNKGAPHEVMLPLVIKNKIY